MVTSLVGNEIEHSIEMSPEASMCVYMLGNKHLEKIDSAALND